MDYYGIIIVNYKVQNTEKVKTNERLEQGILSTSKKFLSL